MQPNSVKKLPTLYTAHCLRISLTQTRRCNIHSPTVRSTATHNIWLLDVRYRLISRFIFSLKNPLKHAPHTHWFEGWQLVCRICRPRRRLFYGNNFLKRLRFHTSVEIKHSIAHLRQKALCTAQCMDVFTRAGTLFPPSIQTTMDSSMWSENVYFDPLIHV